MFVLLAGDLENQFQVLREQLYQEQIRQIDSQLNDIHNERSTEYLEPLQRLNEIKEARVEVAGVLRKYRTQNLNHEFLSEEQGALQHFEVSHSDIMFCPRLTKI